MSNKLLNLIYNEYQKRSIINGIAFLSIKKGITPSNKELLEKIIDQYHPDNEDIDPLLIQNNNEEFFYEEIYKDMKNKNIIKAIILLDKHNCLDSKYLVTIKDLVNKIEKGYHI